MRLCPIRHERRNESDDSSEQYQGNRKRWHRNIDPTHFTHEPYIGYTVDTHFSKTTSVTHRRSTGYTRTMHAMHPMHAYHTTTSTHPHADGASTR